MTKDQDKDFLASAIGEAVHQLHVVEEIDMDAYVADYLADRDGSAVRKPKPKPKAAPPDEKPKPQQGKAKPEEPKAKPEAEAPKDEPPPPPIIDPAAPLDNARAFAQRELHRDGTSAVWFSEGKFWRWNGQCYAPMGDTEMRGQVYGFLDTAQVCDVPKRTAKFTPSKHHVDTLLDALRSCLALGPKAPPMWLDDDTPADDWIVFRNVIVNARTMETRPLTHRLWSHTALDFDWDPSAECPTWERFCDDLFPGDVESVQCLEEMMGYCMTGDTVMEKAFEMIGPRRSGKTTIVALIGKLVGEASYVGLSLNDWLATPKSAQVLLGKRVVAFPDVRLKPPKLWGRNMDLGGIDNKSLELLLKITGRDPVSIGQLYEQAWNGILPVKVIITSNEVPNFNDASGVLATRFIKLQFRNSFAGREDVNLRSKLIAELPGIAAYCLGAYQRLLARGHFVQPASADELERAVASASDPFTAMAMELFVPDPVGMVIKSYAYARFEQWCDDNGQAGLKIIIRDNMFGTRLREVSGFAGITDIRPKGQPRHWLGLRFRKAGDR
jgi:putative DNA primase/helicase